MSDQDKSKQELVEELDGVRKRLAELRRGAPSDEALRVSEERYRALYNDIPLMYFKLDPRGTVLSVNTHGAESLGYTPDDLVGQSVLKVFHPDDKPKVEASLATFVEQPQGVAKWEFRKVRKNGTMLWVQETVRASQGPKGLEILVVCEDVTERKEADRQLHEHQKQLEALTSALSIAEERERRRIGRGLHDEVAQLLALAKLNVGHLETCKNPEERVAQVTEIRALLDRSIQATRTLIFELASPVLYELGLSAALQELGDGVERQGIAFRYASDHSMQAPNGEVDAVLFRVARELVNNALKHARAKTISVALEKTDDQLHVTVEDDGVGFDFAQAGQVIEPSKGFGLFSIRQQVDQLGGRLEFHAGPGGGTRAEACVPWKAE